MNTLFFNGKSSLPLDQFINLVGGSGYDGSKKDLIRLYETVSWLYRGVQIRENGVSSMPFEIRKNDNVVFEHDPNSGIQTQPPKDLEYLIDVADYSGMIEGASTLRGKGYIQILRNTRRPVGLQWFLPDSIDPAFDAMGQVSGWIRTVNGKERTLPPEEIIPFWLPDKFVENGPAKNFPGKAALNSAGVLSSMDEFLEAYFKRGMVKAGFLRYEQPINDEDEKRRVKEWWDRLTSGVARAFESLIVRSDFSYHEIGDGLKDLENSSLTMLERESIATALGIPQSKMSQPPGGLGDTKTPDDLQFIDDTVIPACNWIQKVWNKYLFLPLGYMMVYTPQKLPIKQQDEERRANAFRLFVGSGVAPGLTVDEAIEVLGIHIPDDVREERPDFQQLVNQSTGVATADIVKALDWQGERDQFVRWLKKRKFKAIKVDDFKSRYLSNEEKTTVALETIRGSQKALTIDKLFDEYGDMLANYVTKNISKPKDEFLKGYETAVFDGLLAIFIKATGVDDELTPTEQAAFDRLFQTQKTAVPGFVNELYDRKGVAFDLARESLQKLGGNLGGRLQMWKNAARLFWNRGLIAGRREETMTWRIGSTEDSCNDCLFYNGQTKTKDEWATLAGVLIYPQSRALECNGFNCDCTMVLE